MKQGVFLATSVAFSGLFLQPALAQPLPPQSPPPTPKPVTVRPPTNDGFYDATLADFVRKAKADSAEASRRCDIAAMRKFIPTLWSMARDLTENQEGLDSAPLNLFRPEDLEIQMENDVGQLRRAGDALEALARARQEECASYGTDGDNSDEDDWSGDAEANSVSAQLFVKGLNLPDLAFLGREQSSALGPVLGLFKTDDKKAVAGFALKGVLGGLFGSAPAGEFKFDLGLEFQNYRASTSAVAPSTDLGGDRLVIPGLGVGADGNGFALDSFGGLNTVKDAVATRKFEATSGGISLGISKYDEASIIRLALVAGYESQKNHAAFQASIPGFGRDIAYDQTIDGDIWTFGVEGAVKFPVSKDIAVGGDTRLTLRQGSYDGSNALKFTGFADQMVTDKRSNTGFGATAGAEIEWRATKNTSFIVRGDYTYIDSVPVWSTPGGGERAQIDFGKASSIGAGLIARVRF